MTITHEPPPNYYLTKAGNHLLLLQLTHPHNQMPSRLSTIIDRVKAPISGSKSSSAKSASSSTNSTQASNPNSISSAQHARVKAADKDLDRKERQHRREVEQMTKEKEFEEQHVSFPTQHHANTMAYSSILYSRKIRLVLDMVTFPIMEAAYIQVRKPQHFFA